LNNPPEPGHAVRNKELVIRTFIYSISVLFFAFTVPVFSQRTPDFDAAANKKLRGMQVKYLSRLSSMEKTYKAAGNLEGLLAVQAEMKAVSESVPAPAEAMAKAPSDLLKVRKQWAGAMQQYDAWVTRERGKYAQQEIKRLEAEVVHLTQSSKIEEAMAIKKKVDAMKAEMALAAAPSSTPALSSSTPSTTSTPSTSSTPSTPSTPGGGKAAALSPEGLIVYIDFEEASGVYQDRSPARMPLVNRGVKSVENGVRGRAGRFDGHTTYLRLTPPREYRSMTDFTISAWIRMERRSGKQYIFSTIGALPTTRRNIIKPGAALFYDTKSSSRIYSYMHYSVAPLSWRNSYNSETMEDRWIHVVSIRKDGINTLYLNKEPQRLTTVLGSSSSSNTALAVAPPWYVGDLTGGNRHYSETVSYNFKGLMDEFMFFTRAIGEDEIGVLYDRGK